MDKNSKSILIQTCNEEATNFSEELRFANAKDESKNPISSPTSSLKSSLFSQKSKKSILQHRISPYFPLTPFLPKYSVFFSPAFLPNSSLFLVSGCYKSTSVAHYLANSINSSSSSPSSHSTLNNYSPWVEWFDCSSFDSLYSAYLEFAGFVLGDSDLKSDFHPDRDHLICLAERINSDLKLGLKLATLPRMSRSKHFFREENDSIYSAMPIFVFDNVTSETIQEVSHIVKIYRGGQVFITTDMNATLISTFDIPESRMQAINIPQIEFKTAKKFLSRELPKTLESDLDLLLSTIDLNITDLILAVGCMKNELGGACSVQGYLGARSHLLDQTWDINNSDSPELMTALVFICSLTTSSLPLWPVLVLAALIGTNPFKIDSLIELGVELLKCKLDCEGGEYEDLSLQKSEDSVSTAKALVGVREIPVVEQISDSILNSLQKLSNIGLLELETMNETPLPYRRASVPRKIRNAVFARCLNPRHPLGKLFFESLRFSEARLLFATSMTGPSDLLLSMINEGHSVSGVHNGITPLHMSAIKGSPHLAAILLNNSADLNALDLLSRTPLFYACLHNNYEMAKFLISKNASLNFGEASQNATPLHVCAAYGHADLCRALINAGSSESPQLFDTLETPLHLAVRNKQVECVKILLDGGASLTLRDGTGLTPFHLAVRVSSMEVIQALSDCVMNFDEVDADGLSPIHLLAANKHHLAAKILLSKNNHMATIRKKSDGETALHIAIRNHDELMIDIICEADPDVLLIGPFTSLEFEERNSINNDESAKSHTVSTRHPLPPVHLATLLNVPSVIARLLFHARKYNYNKRLSISRDGLTVSSQFTEKLSPLHFAVSLPDNTVEGALATLIQCGAVIDVLDSKNRTALHLAAIKGHVRQIQHLLDSGASVNGPPGALQKRTPLAYACSYGWVDSVRVLIERGGKLGVKGTMWRVFAKSNKIPASQMEQVAEVLKSKKVYEVEE